MPESNAYCEGMVVSYLCIVMGMTRADKARKMQIARTAIKSIFNPSAHRERVRELMKDCVHLCVRA